tara:strand:- start:4983 stop:9305 length:4323 start_codon:yes stop_codon:yes gene_type:complete
MATYTLGDPIKEDQQVSSQVTPTTGGYTLGDPVEEKGFFETVGDVAVNTAGNIGSNITDISKGVFSGLINIPTGVLQLGTLGIDAAFDTNTTRAVTEASNYVKDVTGLRPTGTAGQVAEGITTFASAFIPVVGWLGRASTVARGGTLLPSAGASTLSKFGQSAVDFGSSGLGKTLLKTRTRQAVTTTLASGSADIFVAPDGTKTMSDSFDGLPEMLQTESDTGLLGRDEAGRVFRNKLRVGAEGTVFAGAFEAAFPVIKGVTYGAGQVMGATGAASALSKGFDKLGDTLVKVPKLQQWFTTAGSTPKDFAEDILSAEGIRDQLTDTAAKNFVAFETAVKKTVKGQGLFGRGKEGIQKAMTDLNVFLEGDIKALDGYDSSVKAAAQTMRGQIDGLSDLLSVQLKSAKDAGEISAKKAESILQEFETNQLKYIRRVYELHLDPNKIIDPKILQSKQYMKAVDEVAKFYKNSQNAKIDKKVKGYVKGDEGKIKTDEELTQLAKLFTAKQLGLDMIENGLTPEAAAKLAAKSAEQGKDMVKGRVPLYKLSESLFKKRIGVLDAAPTLRKIMGEITDPRQRYLRTVGDMSSSFASLGLYRALANNPSYTKTLSDVVEAQNAGSSLRPLIVDAGEQSGKELEKFAAQTGYKMLPLDAKSVFGGEFGALSGKAVAPEIYNALTVVGKNKNFFNEVLAASLVAKGLSQVAKTVLNPLAQIRNFNSGSFMIMANGNVPRNLELGESMRLTLGKGANLDQKEFKQVYDFLGRAGIRDQNIVVNEFRQLLNEGSNVATGSRQAGAVQSFMDKAPIISGLQKIYSGTDTFWKVAGYFAEKGKYAAAFKKAGLNASLKDEVGSVVQKQLVDQKIAPRSSALDMEGLDKIDFVDVMSTDIVKKTMPTYSRVPAAVKAVRRIPIAGNFVAFPAEIIRNTANITSQSLKEMSFKVTDELVGAMAKKIATEAGTEVTEEVTKQAMKKANSMAREIRAIGARRMSGYVASAYAIPVGAGAAANSVLEITPEQSAALQRSLPSFLRGHTIVPMSKPEDGKLEYIDFSYMNPYDFMLAPARKALEIYSEKSELGKSDVDAITSGMWEGFKSIAEPFAGQSLAFERVQDIIPFSAGGRGGRTPSGAEIYDESDLEAGFPWEKSVNHVLGGFNPGLVEMFYKENRGRLGPGRVTKALTGEPGPYGEQYFTEDEALALVTGFRKMEHNSRKSLGFLGNRYSKLRNQASGNFSSIAKRNDATEAEIIDKYVEQNNTLKVIQGKLKQQIDDAIALGMSESDVRRTLIKDGKVSAKELSAIMRGEFAPFRITPSLIRSINIETNIKEEKRLTPVLPREKLFDIFDSLRGSPLLVPDEEEAIDEPQGSETNNNRPTYSLGPVSQAQPVQQSQQVAATLAPPGVAQAGPTTAPSVGPASSTTTDPATLAAIIPNPRDQVLAARLRGTA